MIMNVPSQASKHMVAQLTIWACKERPFSLRYLPVGSGDIGLRETPRKS